MVVSQNRGTPIQSPKYHNPCYRNPQNGTPNFGNPPPPPPPAYLQGYNITISGQSPKFSSYGLQSFEAPAEVLQTCVQLIAPDARITPKSLNSTTQTFKFLNPRSCNPNLLHPQHVTQPNTQTQKECTQKGKHP